jgi:CRISPR/Cas system-associated endoribonuclease Cas2
MELRNTTHSLVTTTKKRLINMAKSVSITMSGKNGIFSVENKASLFLGHTTQTNLIEYLKEIKKVATSSIKSNELMVTICSMDSNCHRTDEVRFIYRGAYAGTIVLDVRKYNGYDYSDSKELHFTKDSDLTKYLMKEMETTIKRIMGTLPLEQSYYSQILDEKEVPAHIAEFVKK